MASTAVKTLVKTLDIVMLGNPALRKTCAALTVEELATPSVQNYIDRMKDTLLHLEGAGLAAPQVAWGKRVVLTREFVDELVVDGDGYNVPNMTEPEVMVNPVITSHSKEYERDWEQCLSISGLTGCVPRWKSVDIAYLNRDGKEVERRVEGFGARCIQHEVDHLDGTTFIERIVDIRDLFLQSEYEKWLEKDPQVIIERMTNVSNGELENDASENAQNVRDCEAERLGQQEQEQHQKQKE